MAIFDLINKCHSGKNMEEKNFATEILKELKATNKRLFIALIVVTTLWFATIGGFLWYNSLPVDSGSETTSVSQDSEDSGTNNYVGGDYNGKTNDKDS